MLRRGRRKAQAGLRSGGVVGQRQCCCAGVLRRVTWEPADFPAAGAGLRGWSGAQPGESGEAVPHRTTVGRRRQGRGPVVVPRCRAEWTMEVAREAATACARPCSRAAKPGWR